MENKSGTDRMKTTFGWDLCYICNYRCPYCKGWERAGQADLIQSPEIWESVWKRIYGKYGECHIFVSGGEPSVYPGFYDLMLKIAAMHEIDICTNFSWQPEKLTDRLPPGRLTISATFHPDFADFEEFFAKAVKARAYLPSGQIYTVASHKFTAQLPVWSERFKQHGIKLVPIPLRGYEEVLNTETEKKVIEETSPYAKDEKLDYQLRRVSPKGKLCRAGQKYAVIRTTGKVDRCSQTTGGEVGFILDEDFKLFDSPRPCEKDYCPIESQWILPDK